MAFHLLLTDIDALEAAESARAPATSIDALGEPPDAAKNTAQPPFFGTERRDALDVQRWGVVLSAGATEDMLEWIRPLCDLRAAQCGLAGARARIPTFEVPPGLDRRAAKEWRAAAYNRLPRAQRPRYLLILGDLDQVSLATQQELMQDAFVGRLCFKREDGADDADGYRAYAAKIVASEQARARWGDDATLLFYASRREDDDTLEAAYADLLRRSVIEAKKDRDLPVAHLQSFGRYDEHGWHAGGAVAEDATLLHWAASAHPSILLSVTHGAASSSPERRRLRQGAPVIEESRGQRRREIWDAQAFGDRPFLPGGFWFSQACFSAGTPVESVYTHWLTTLTERGLGNTNPALTGAYASTDRPFIARLPQALLANPDGPLGVVGHVDLAWSYGYQDAAGDDHALRGDSAHSPYYGLLRSVAMGSRFGNALSSLTDKASQAATQVALLYGQLEERGDAPDKDRARRAWLWMQHLDLAGYILLGDPAAQLPTRSARLVCESEAELSRARGERRQDRGAAPGRAAADSGEKPAQSAPVHDAEAIEQAVFRWIRQEDPGRVAADMGIDKPTLESWVTRYRQAGRAALAKTS